MVLNSIFKKQKKGNAVVDSLFFFVAVVIFVLIAITGSYVLDLVNTDVQNDADMSTVSKTNLALVNTNYPAWFDYGILAVFVLLWVLVIVASLYIDSHPVFFMLSIIALMIVIFAVNAFMESVDDYLADADISPTTVSFPIAMFIVSNIEKIIAVVGMSIAIALYAKYKA